LEKKTRAKQRKKKRGPKLTQKCNMRGKALRGCMTPPVFHNQIGGGSD